MKDGHAVFGYTSQHMASAERGSIVRKHVTTRVDNLRK